MIKNGLVREVSTIDAANWLEREGYELEDSAPEADIEEGKQIMRRDLEVLTVEHLASLCAERNIDAPKSSKKVDLIQLIIDHDAPKGEENGSDQ